jgi:ribosomal protein S18 acetylase RimI-like enzyme
MIELAPFSPEHRSAFLDLEYAASAAYNSFVYRDRGQADGVRTLLFDADRAEFGPSRSSILLEDGALAGMVSCLAAQDLSKCRMRCAYALAKSHFFDDDPGLADRIALAGKALARPAPADFYLSRIAVAPGSAGSGAAARLLEHCEAQAARAGATRILLEVASCNARAIAFYRRSGFEAAEEASVSSDDGTLALTYTHMVKRLD